MLALFPIDYMSNSIIEAREAFYENYPVPGGVNPTIHVPHDPEESRRQTEILRGVMWDVKMTWEQFCIAVVGPKKRNRPTPLPTGYV